MIFCSCAATHSIRLDGSKSYDPDGYISKYEWKQISGDSVGILNSASSITTAKVTKNGIYSFELRVTDNQGATDKDTTIINYSMGSK